MKDRCFFVLPHLPFTKILFSLEATLPALPEKTENTNESTIMFFLNEKGRIADSYLYVQYCNDFSD